MSGGGRRGRRGGRRQRRREEQLRNGARTTQPRPQPTNGQSGPGHVVLPSPVLAQPDATRVTAPVIAPPAQVPAPSASAVTQGAQPEVHPRPISARELVARLEAMRAEAAHEHDPAGIATLEPTETHVITPEEPSPPAPSPADDVRRFATRAGEWLARRVGRGTGGTGRVAQARIEAIRFFAADAPDVVVGEALVPRANLNDLYDDELATLLERALRAKEPE